MERTHCTPHILLVSQKVKDIKVPANGDLERRMGSLRAWLHRHSFIPGDKIPATLTPQSIEHGVLVADISGNLLSSDLYTGVVIRQGFPLFLTNYDGPMNVEAVFSSVQGARVDDGGNVQNMILNVAIVFAGLIGKFKEVFGNQVPKLTVASSTDPFLGVPADLRGTLRSVCDTHFLNVPDRFSIQVPWEYEGAKGTLAITSEPHRTNTPLEQLIKNTEQFGRAFQKATCFVSSDPLYDQLARYARPPYACVVNASTAFRSLVAAESYSRTAILPMNNGEAADVCRLLLQRGLEQELAQIDRPPFPVPLATTGAEIDRDALTELDRSLDMFIGYNPLHRNPDGPSFTCPITFGADGGLLIGVCHENIACFSSIPSPAGEKLLLEEFGCADRIKGDRSYEVGAGDAVAAVITIFNAINPHFLVESHMDGPERHNNMLKDLASTLFVGTLGRIIGNFLIRTEDTYWSNIRLNAISALLDEAATECLTLARTLVRRLYAPCIGEIKKWGIKTVLWQPGKVAYPHREMTGEEWQTYTAGAATSELAN